MYPGLLLDGGPFALILLAISLVAVPMSIALALGIGLAKARIPASLGWLGLVVVAATGALGAYTGVAQVHAALASAAPESQPLLINTGRNIALLNAFFAQLALTAGIVGSALATSLSALVAPGPEARFDPSAVGASTLGALLGAGLTALLVLVLIGLGGATETGPIFLFAPMVAAVITLAAIVASARVSETPEHQARLAGSRALIGLSGLVAGCLLGEAGFNNGASLAHAAVAAASYEQKGLILAAGMAVAWNLRLIGWMSGLAPLLAGLGGALPHLRQLGPRELAGALLATANAVGLLLWWPLLGWWMGDVSG